uniref:ERI1 exoribonuclease 2 n=1 Tax=Salmo trutta TaxID=8032 RepID=A0A674A127_SALTR
MSTKKLAKQLGFVRKRSQSSTGQKKPLTSNQIFPYLIVIDFESTCWRERNSYGQEIIEFPAVLLNTATGEVESEFHTYVQPQEHPTLSDFCTQLTGTTQQQVEAGVPLHICLSRFSRWLQTLEHQRGVVFPRDQRAPLVQLDYLCPIVSDWDLGVCLLYECKRKQLHKPAVLNSWIDLRATYRLFYNRKPKGLNGALQDLGIQFSGREHSGLDDARNTAHLAWRMMRDGCVMKITRSLERVSGVLTNPHYYTPSTNDPTVLTTPGLLYYAPKDSPRGDLHRTLGFLSTPQNTHSSSRKDSRANNTVRLLSYDFQYPLSSSLHQQPRSGLHHYELHYPSTPARPDPETGSMEEDLPILVETESCCSYDDMVLHAETPNSSFMIHKYSSCLSSVSRPSVGGSSSILSSSVNRSLFLPNRSTKITAPLCDCGRRAKRLTVCNGGPNQGRAFYCCVVRKHGPGGTRKGCELFKWESALLQAKSPASAAASIALCFGLNSSVVRPPVII